MKAVKVKYNPYLLKTIISVDGNTPKPNSKLNFGKLRLQEWAENMPQILLEEYSDRNFKIDFTGTQSDFDDLKEALTASKNFQWVFVGENIQKSVSEVERNIDEIFKTIQQGPIEQLHDEKIREAFLKAKNSEFEVNVIATMSSGKSTLINALLGKKLMPVANMATTATIVKIIATDQKDYSAKAYDTNGVLIKEEANINYQTMKDWNKDPTISSIEIHGKIPCVQSVGMRLVLVDTPGPNNSRDSQHKRLTYDMLYNSNKSLVLFVMNATQLNVDDQDNLMKFVCECMEKGGKQSRERYIFAINKMDGFNPEDDEEPRDALESAKEMLLEYKILSPNLFPVSAQAALEFRTDTSNSALPVFIPRLQQYPIMKFDNYYEYNHLPQSVKKNIEDMLQQERENNVEIHTGIVSIEQAIGLYINKYARSLKVKDLVDSFNNRLNELKAVAVLKSEIRQNKDRKIQLDQQIEEINQTIVTGESAKTLSRLIEGSELEKKVIEDIKSFVDQTSDQISEIIFQNNKRIPLNQAVNNMKPIEKQSSAILQKLGSRVDHILKQAYENLLSGIITEYKTYLNTLGLSSDKNDLGLHPLVFVAEDLADVNHVISKHMTTVDEGYDETRQREVRGKKKTSWIWRLFHGWTDRYETKTETYTVHIQNNVEYVEMSSVVNEYIKPIQQQLIYAQKTVESHVNSEAQRIKTSLKSYFEEIEKLLQQKLEELKKSTNTVAQTQKEIEQQEKNLKWMEAIINHVNELINF